MDLVPRAPFCPTRVGFEFRMPVQPEPACVECFHKIGQRLKISGLRQAGIVAQIIGPVDVVNQIGTGRLAAIYRKRAHVIFRIASKLSPFKGGIDLNLPRANTPQPPRKSGEESRAIPGLTAKMLQE